MDARLTTLLLLALNLALKLLWLGVNDLAHDEPFTVYWSQRPWPEMRAMLLTENNPPLHFLITRWWSLLVPFDAAWLRVPSALFSALAVVPLHQLALRVTTRRAALTAALLFTFSNFHYGLAHEVRAYALFTLLAVTSVWIIVRRLRAPEAGWPAILQLAIVNALMAYTHYFAWLMIGVQLLIVLGVPGLRGWRTGFPLSGAITAVLFAPMAAVLAARAGQSIAQGTWLTHPLPEELYNMVWKWSNAPVVAAACITLIVLGFARRRPGDAALRLGALWGLVPLVGMYMVSQFVPMFLDRYLVFAAPGFALLVASCSEALRLSARLTGLLQTTLVAGMALTFTPWRPGLYQPSRVAAQVAEWCGTDCYVEVVPPWYWLNLKAGEDITLLRQDQSALLRSTPLVPDSAQAAALGPYILVDASGGLEYDQLREALRRAYPAAMRTAEPDHRLRVYRFGH